MQYNIILSSLRYPENKQCRSRLFDGTGYCCLGRLCVVLGMEPTRLGDGFAFDGQPQLLPSSAQHKAGMCSKSGHLLLHKFVSLSLLNDDGKTFTEIAEVIEKHWEEL